MQIQSKSWSLTLGRIKCFSRNYNRSESWSKSRLYSEFGSSVWFWHNYLSWSWSVSAQHSNYGA